MHATSRLLSTTTEHTVALTCDTERSPLGKLPPELCNYIYELILTQPDQTITVTLHYDEGQQPLPHTYRTSPQTKERRILALTTTCYAIRNESLPLLYALNTLRLTVNFRFWPLGGFEGFLVRMSRDTRSALRVVEVENCALIHGDGHDHKVPGCEWCAGMLSGLTWLRQWSLENPGVSFTLRFIDDDRRTLLGCMDMRSLDNMVFHELNNFRGGELYNGLSQFRSILRQWQQVLREVKVDGEH